MDTRSICRIPALDLCDGCGSGGTIQDNYDRRANYASSDNDVRLRYVFAGSLELPFGKGKAMDERIRVRFGGSRRLAADGDLPDADRTSVHAGLVVRRANAGTTTRPNRFATAILIGGTVQRCSIRPASRRRLPYVFGNAGRNILRAPGMNNLDFSLQRDFRMPMEHATLLQFRAEAFNLFNHAQFGAPGSTVGSTTYGVITSTSTDARQLQLGVRVTF